MPRAENDNRPNVLLLFCDQLRPDALGAYGNEHVHTPNLDRLASQGVTFEQAYTPVPVCVPARYCLLTGHQPRVHGYWNNSSQHMDNDIPTIPRIMRRAGYITEAIGKMHFQPYRAHHGFERMQLMEETPPHREDDDYLMYLKSVGLGNVQQQHGVRHLLYQQPQRSLIPEEHTGNHWVADRTIDFLETHKNRPFFLWSSWIAPHPPFNTVDKWADFYDTDKMPLPLTHPDEVVSDHAEAMAYLGDTDGSKSEERRIRRIKRIKACYYACVSHVDEQVGRILDKLDELGLSENTIVIFTSDHGEMLGDHGACQKSCSYEGAWAIPMLVRGPGVAAGERTKAFASLLDIMPTCIEASKGRYPSFDVPLPGHSLLDVEELSKRDVIFGHQGPNWTRFIVVRNKRYKLTYWLRDGSFELFDMQEDPEEFHNLMLKDRTHDQQIAFERHP